MNEEGSTDFVKLADYISMHTICVDGIDVLSMPFVQIRSLYSTLFPNASQEGKSYEEIVNCIVGRLVFILLNKESPESCIFFGIYV